MHRQLPILAWLLVVGPVLGQSSDPVALPVISTEADLKLVLSALESKDPSQVRLGLFAARALDPTTSVAESGIEARIGALIAQPDHADAAIETLADWPLSRAALDALMKAQASLDAICGESADRIGTRERLAIVISTFPDDRVVAPLQKTLAALLSADRAAGLRVADEFMRVKSKLLYFATRKTVSAIPDGSSAFRKLLREGRYEFSTYADALGELPTAAQLQWIIALGAPYVIFNGGDHHLFGGRGRNRHSLQDYRQSLSAWWGIEDEAGFRSSLAWLQESGHRESQNPIIERVRGLSPEERTKLTDPVDLLVARMIEDGSLGKHGTLGWDYVRLGSMIGWGYVCEYISLDEAMSLGMAAARKTQQSFDSWEALFASYVAGRAMWIGNDTDPSMKVIQDACRWLVKDPASPCRRVAWNLKLEP